MPQDFREIVKGRIDGIRDSWLEEMADWLELGVNPEEYVSDALVARVARMSARINREIAIFLSREGSVVEVSVGDASTAPLSNLRLRRSVSRLSGVRCLHTHPGGDPHLSAVDLRSLMRLRLDSMCAVGVSAEGRPTGLSAAFLTVEHGALGTYVDGPFRRVPQTDWLRRIREADTLIGRDAAEAQPRQERAVLVGYVAGEDDASMIELRRLAETAGAEVVRAVTQRPGVPDPATYIGKGKADELALVIGSMPCELCVFNDELTGAQSRNLEERLGVRVIDRTTLILDIFAARAASREGKMQVELAQLYYRLPRLSGMGIVLSRLGGGIGTRGPGETQLETDRRAIRRRIGVIERDLKELARQRGVRKARRERQAVPTVALIGYTNAGKSTLLTALSGAEAFAEDKLFATLDPLMRRVVPAEGREYLLVDTVGFIDKLPHDLVKAFTSTLEEALSADLLVIVHDGLSADIARQARVVDDVLVQMGAGGRLRLDALNKIDAVDPMILPNALPISARTREGLDRLEKAIQQKLSESQERVVVTIPYDKASVQAFLHEHGTVLKEEYGEDGIRLEVELASADAQRAMALMTPR